MNVPGELLENREIIEGSVVLTYYKQPELLDEFKLDVEKDLVTHEAKLLYSLAEKMYNSGVTVFDQVSIESYLLNYPVVKNELDKYGGSKSVIKESQVMNPLNMDKNYDDLLKANLLIDFYNNGYDVLRELDKFKRMPSSEDVYNYIEYKMLDSVSTKVSKNTEISDMYFSDEFYDEIIDGTSFETVSFHTFSPMLNNAIGGIPLSALNLLCGSSGSGKSTWLMNLLYSAMKDGQKVAIVSNELSRKQYMYVFITMVLVDKFKYYNLTRNKIKRGQLNDLDKEMLRKAQAYFNENLKDKMVFLIMKNNNLDEVTRQIRKAAKLGAKIACYDTLKSDGGSEEGWKQITNSSNELCFLAQKEGIAVYLSFQLAPYGNDKRWLHRGLMSEGKNAIFTASTNLMMRPMRIDELDKKSKYYIRPYRLVKNEESGKWTRIEVEVPNDGTKYNIMWVDKSRDSEDGAVVLYKFRGHHGVFEEVCFCTPYMDM